MNPTKLSEAELNELAELLVTDDIGFGCETLEEAQECVRTYPTVKFPEYITDCPGYSGELFILTGGIPHPVAIIRNPERKMVFSQD